MKTRSRLLFREAMRCLFASYMASEDWQRVKRSVFERARGVCADCGANAEKGVAHHVDYRDWGSGGPSEQRDCVWLCKQCHRKRHNRKEGHEHFVKVPFFAQQSGHDPLDYDEQHQMVWQINRMEHQELMALHKEDHSASTGSVVMALQAYIGWLGVLDSIERDDLERSLSDIVTETPKTLTAARTFAALARKAGADVFAHLWRMLEPVACDTAKREIGS